jgi:S-DNA-T family DNA segregation ATPase FtsK/SpoIIIE
MKRNKEQAEPKAKHTERTQSKSRLSINEAENSQLIDKLSKQYTRQIQVIAVLLALLSLMVFLSIITYSPRDEISSNISFGDFLSLIRGDREVAARVDGIENWLGIFGAICSNLLINFTFGYAIVFLPVFVWFWAKRLFLRKRISEVLIRRTILYFILGLLFASFMGALDRSEWFGMIHREWYGAAGYFIATIAKSLIGSIGSLLVFFVLFVLAFVFGSNIKAAFIKEKIKPITEKLKLFFVSLKSKFQKKEAVQDTVAEPKIEQSDFIAAENNSIDDEPARIIQRNLTLQINRPEFTSTDTHFNDDDYSYQVENEAKSGFAAHSEHFRPASAQNKAEDNTDKSEQYKFPARKIPEGEPQRLESPSTQKNSHLPIIEKIIVEEVKTEEYKEPTQSEDKDNIDSIEGIASIQDIDNSQKKLEDSFKESGTDKEQPQTQIQAESVTEELIELERLEKGNISEVLLEVERKAEEKQPKNPLSTSLLDEEINYIPPPVTLLADSAEEFYANEEELRTNARILQEKLETFKIYIENLSVTPGPVVTQYEFVPAPGIKISRIESLTDDMAMALKAKGIRIIAPIPGKGTIGIEIPNHKPSLVRFSSIVNSAKYINTTHKLPIALGKTISGEIFCADLTRMPHLLIAGATGSGKSVGINTLIASLIFKMHPRDLKFVIVDPKKVELKQYSALERHFLAVSPDLQSSIITDPQEAVIALKAVCAEMDLRYDILARSRQRNILEYNEKVREGKFKDDKEVLHKPMPYIVVIIDELADLMLTASKEVEGPIIRLAQLARAVGIHCVVATQRPSVDVITGIIKANFPARVAYLVASKIDSRTILDTSGADQLLGNGDMLFLAGGSPKPIRLQNAYISTDEIEAICDFIGDQEGYSQPYTLPSIAEDSLKGGISREDRDALFEEAARLVVQQQQASVSLLQRRLKVGYARAGRMIDELEDAGIIGPFEGSKTRKVFILDDDELEMYL